MSNHPFYTIVVFVLFYCHHHVKKNKTKAKTKK